MPPGQIVFPWNLRSDMLRREEEEKQSKSEKLRYGEVFGYGGAHEQGPLGYKVDEGIQSREELLSGENAVD